MTYQLDISHLGLPVTNLTTNCHRRLMLTDNSWTAVYHINSELNSNNHFMAIVHVKLSLQASPVKNLLQQSFAASVSLLIAHSL